MWNESQDTRFRDGSSSPTSGQPETRPAAAKRTNNTVIVRLTRPDGSTRDIKVAGHFREEHLCSLVDDELCQLELGETLVVHLFQTDPDLAQSLRSRWDEGLSDNRPIFMREVLGPDGNTQQLARQLHDIHQRMASGEKVSIAIRSPKVAKSVRRQLRKLLLLSQQSDRLQLQVWVDGNKDQQQEILSQLAGQGMVRIKDYEEYRERHPGWTWKAPWRKPEPSKPTKKRKHRPHRTAEDAVTAWIKKVEAKRDRH
jgi:hypothetical protein